MASTTAGDPTFIRGATFSPGNSQKRGGPPHDKGNESNDKRWKLNKSKCKQCHDARKKVEHM